MTTEYSLVDLGVDFTETGKLENLEKNPWSTEETNYINSTHSSSKLIKKQHTGLYPGGHPSSYNNPVQPGLTSNSELTAYATNCIR